MKDHWDTILAFLVERLPSDVDARRAILNSLVAVFPRKDPRHAHLKESLHLLDAHLVLQRELFSASQTTKAHE